MPDLPTPPSPHHGEAERWLPVVGYEGLYEVSDLGRIWSKPRSRTRGGILRQVPNSHGYLAVGLSREGHQRGLRVHQIVAAAFIGPCPEGQQVRHGPNGKLDNRASQLCYGTPQDDRDDMVRDGHSRHGSRSYFAKLTEAVVAECRTRWSAGERVSDLAPEFGVTWKTMNRAVTGQTWQRVVDLTPGQVQHVQECHGTKMRGDRHRSAKLTAADVPEIRASHAAGVSQSILAAEYGVSQVAISCVVLRKTWKHVA